MAFSVPTLESFTELGRAQRNSGDPDTSSLAVAGLNGDLTDYYVIEYRILQPSGSVAACDYQLLPNGSSLDTESKSVANGGSVVSRSAKGLILGLTATGRRCFMGRYQLYTSRTPYNAATARDRFGFGLAGITDDPPSGSDAATFATSGAFFSADNITSLAIATVSLDTTTLINQVAAGSYMRVLAPLGVT